MTDDTKLWWQSRTILGSLLTLISIALGQFNIALDAETLQGLLDVVIQIGEVVGVLIALYGRFRATKQVTL